MDPDREPPQQPSPLSELTDEKLNAEVAELTGASGYARNPRAQRRRPQDDRGHWGLQPSRPADPDRHSRRTHDPHRLDRERRTGSFDDAFPGGKFPRNSLWTRDVEAEVLPLCGELGIGFVAYSPLGRGILIGRVTSLEFTRGPAPAAGLLAGMLVQERPANRS